jgi:hypothetical protein
VLAAVKSAGGQSLAPGDVRDFLVRHDVEVELQSVRRALRRLADRGELGVEDGRYFDLRPQSRTFEYGEILAQLEGDLGGGA